MKHSSIPPRKALLLIGTFLLPVTSGCDVPAAERDLAADTPTPAATSTPGATAAGTGSASLYADSAQSGELEAQTREAQRQRPDSLPDSPDQADQLGATEETPTSGDVPQGQPTPDTLWNGR